MHFNFRLDGEILGANIGLWVVLIIHSGPVFGGYTSFVDMPCPLNSSPQSMINVDSALRLHLKAVQGLGIDGDSVKRLTNMVERRLEFH